jgi:phosphatidylserine/phosphatidylglycerophosphate/cardiolipin synthase-like enzyme
MHDPTGRPGPSEACEVALCTSLLERIEAAERSIDFAIYGLRGQPEILRALKAAKARGVVIRGVVDRDAAGKTYYDDTDALVAAIGDVRDDSKVDAKAAAQAAKDAERAARAGEGAREPGCPRPEGFDGFVQCLTYDLGDRCIVAAHASREELEGGSAIMHDKFFVFDGRWVWTGSTNVSDAGVGGYNANLVTLVDSRQVAEAYTREFEQMHAGRFHTTKRSAGVTTVALGDATVDVLFSPQDRPISSGVRPLLRRAKRRIDVAVFFLTNKLITRDLIDAHRRGVEVRVILDATAATNGYTKHELLRAAGIPLKIENWGGKMHMKSAAIDGEHVITGSMNWTSAGEYDNDENTIIIHSKAHAAQYHAAFDGMWANLDDRWLQGRPDPESKDSTTACSDGSDNDFDRLKDADDPGCGAEPPPLAPLPPYRVVDKAGDVTCSFDALRASGWGESNPDGSAKP